MTFFFGMIFGIIICASLTPARDEVRLPPSRPEPFSDEWVDAYSEGYNDALNDVKELNDVRNKHDIR